jgi:anti-anti-sigma factor
MEITRQQMGDALELKIEGRLDGYWADHLLHALEDVIRGGARHLRLNLAAVTYLSSAGIRVLVRAHKQLSGIQGSFSVTEPSAAVRSILQLTGLLELLVPAVTAVGEKNQPGSGRRLEKENVKFEVVDLAPEAQLTCRVIGDPTRLHAERVGEEDCHSITFSESALGLGLGAFGNSFAECTGRFGEFLALSGAVAYLPADGTNVPDYMLAAGDFVPQMKVLYSILCEGDFRMAAHFESMNGSKPGTLSEVVSACLDIAGAEIVGIGMVAESAGLIGAALRRSPALQPSDGSPFDFPQVRDWLSFTAEPVFSRALTLVVGVAARSGEDILARVLRPLGKAPGLTGHFHAAAFSYRPLKRREADLKGTTAMLFETETLQGLLHLLCDDRAVTGVGESEFMRGTCWISPISTISAG